VGIETNISRGRRIGRLVYDYTGLVIGSAILALALDWFTVPNRIAAGGVSGLATITHYLFAWPVGITMLAVNVPLFALSFRIVGLRFGVRSLVGAVVSSILVDVFAPFTRPLTFDPLLASLYGGVLTGLGVGITFYFGGSTGGTDLAARLLHHFTHIGLGRSFLIVDAAVIAWAALAFNAELGMYALLSLFVASKTIDFLQEGTPLAKGAFIISDHIDQIGERIMSELDRGATLLRGRGVYTGKDRDVLMVIVGRPQVRQLRMIVHDADPRAFMVITDVADVLGEGFEPRQL